MTQIAASINCSSLWCTASSKTPLIYNSPAVECAQSNDTHIVAFSFLRGLQLLLQSDIESYQPRSSRAKQSVQNASFVADALSFDHFPPLGPPQQRRYCSMIS
jgi:hypothetical protein